jgi:uncharacterized protein YecT (DUF1311 family)
VFSRTPGAFWPSSKSNFRCEFLQPEVQDATLTVFQGFPKVGCGDPKSQGDGGMETETHADETPGAEPGTPSAEQRIGMAAVMALAIVAGVGVALALPRPEAPPAIELARPAPATAGPLPAWPAAKPQSAPVPPPPSRVAQAPSKPAAPPLRTVRLESAQVARPHAARFHLPRILPAHAVARPPTRPSACRAPVSMADRLVCERPQLAAQDREMRQAYDRALSAGADRLKIDRAQAKWRGQRDRATSETDLSRLYARRIAELDRAARFPGSPGGWSL